MQTTFAAALFAALIAAENVLPDNLAENPHRELRNCPAAGQAEPGVQAACTDETCCIEANAELDVNPWFEYKWNADGCYCEHHWKRQRVVNHCLN